MKIDFIIPYVNCEDENWLQDFKKHGGVLDNSFEGGINRYKDEGILRYVLRSIDKYTPWVNNVYLLVSSESQIPEYINRDKVKIIYHKDFIPEEYLPIFNSSHLETFLGLLYKIKGLSENIVWFNDDMLLNQPLDEEFFFTESGIPKYDIKITDFRESALGDIVRRQCFNTITKLNKNKIVLTKHGTISYKLNCLRKCWEEYDFISTLQQKHATKRLENNICQFAYALYQWMKIPVHKANLKILMCTRKKISLLGDPKYHIICINCEDRTEDENEKIFSWLNDKFPVKSKYENRFCAPIR